MSEEDETDTQTDTQTHTQTGTFEKVWHQVAGHKGHGSAPGICPSVLLSVLCLGVRPSLLEIKQQPRFKSVTYEIREFSRFSSGLNFSPTIFHLPTPPAYQLINFRLIYCKSISICKHFDEIYKNYKLQK